MLHAAWSVHELLFNNTAFPCLSSTNDPEVAGSDSPFVCLRTCDGDWQSQSLMNRVCFTRWMPIYCSILSHRTCLKCLFWTSSLVLAFKLTNGGKHQFCSLPPSQGEEEEAPEDSLQARKVLMLPWMSKHVCTIHVKYIMLYIVISIDIYMYIQMYLLIECLCNI